MAEELYKKKEYVNRGAILKDIEYFDAEFFEFTPNDAKLTDPQQRIFLECAWEALEVSGYPPQTTPRNVGVYGSMSPSTYLLRNISQSKEYGNDLLSYPVMIGNDKDFLCTRVSYKLNLTGPSISVQTACSSSLVAIHTACQSLINGECDMALAGGVSVTVPQQTGYLYKEGGTLSQDGYCRAFDEEATGTVKGNGCGVVLLKLLSQAVEDRDTIHCVIKSTAINNDGKLKIGFTAPSPTGQSKAIREAIEMAGITPEEIEYLEAHGTGTSLGDPIEIKALTNAFDTTDKQYCAIGSVKPNIGHLDAAAGIANVIKATMVLKENAIPKSINYQTANNQIDFQNSPFYVNQSLQRRDKNKPIKYAGVSSFGMGGTNAHAILQKAPERRGETQEGPFAIVISAKTEERLPQMIEQLRNHVKTNPNQALSDIAYTLGVGRTTFDKRTYLVCHSIDDLLNHDATKWIKQSTHVSKATLKSFELIISATANRKYYRDLYTDLFGFRTLVDSLFQKVEEKAGFTSLRNRLVTIEQEFLNEYEDILLQFICLHSLVSMWIHLGIKPTKIVCKDQLSDFVAASIAETWDTDTIIGYILKELIGYPINKLGYPLKSDIDVIASREEELQNILSNPTNKWVEEEKSNFNCLNNNGYLIDLQDRCQITLPILEQDHSPASSILNLLGNLWTLGAQIEWSFLFDKQKVGRIPLPTYPFDKKRYWIDIEVVHDSKTKDKFEINANRPKEHSTSLAEQVTAIWQKCLDIENILQEDDFFLNLDGDSLIAIDVIAEIKEQMEIELSIQDFMKNSTLKGLITFIEQQKHRQSLFEWNSSQIVWKMKEGTMKGNIFFIHPSGGTVMLYNKLAKNINKHPALYGIQFPSELLKKTNLSMEQLASKYISEIRKIQPNGPYYLAGYSFGGNLALEMSIQLQREGIDVPQIILIDSFVPSTYNRYVIDDESIIKAIPILVKALFKSEKNIDDQLIEELQMKPIKEMIEAFYQRNIIPKDFPSEAIQHFLEVWCMNIKMLNNHNPRDKYKGHALVFDAIESGPDIHKLEKYLGSLNTSKEEWNHYIDGHLKIMPLSGNHYSIFDNPKNIKTICCELENYLSPVLF